MSSALEHQLEQEGVAFPVGYCLKCHKEVMVHGRLGEGARDGQLLWRCLFCDEEVLREEEAIRYQTLPELNELGYRVGEPEEQKGASKGGCGSGGGGCHS